MTDRSDIDAKVIIQGESLDGYVARVAADNYIMRVREISGLGGVEYAHRPQLTTHGWEGLPALADALQAPLEELQMRSYPVMTDDHTRRQFFGSHIHCRDLLLKERRYSPTALAASPHHRALWQVGIPFCIETGEILQNSCPRPSCGAVQRWRHTAGVEHCDVCVADLSQQQAETVAPTLLSDIRYAIGPIHPDPDVRLASMRMLPPEIAALGDGYAFELLLRMLPLADRKCTWSNTTRWRHNDPHDLASGFAHAWRLLHGWPETPWQKMGDDFMGRALIDDGSAHPTVNFLKLRKDTSVPNCIAKVIGELYRSRSVEEPDGGLVGAAVSVNEATRISGVRTGTLVACRRAGALKTICSTKRGDLVAYFDRAELESIAEQIGCRSDLDRVTNLIGLPYYAAEGLLADGILQPLDHPYFATRYGSPQTTKDAIHGLARALEDGSCAGIDKAIELFAGMQIIGAKLKPWPAIIVAMLSGELPYHVGHGSSPILSRTTVRKADLVKILARSIDESGPASRAEFMTKRDAGEVLNLHNRTYTELFNHYPASNAPVVPKHEVLRIASSHISLREISARCGQPQMRCRIFLDERGFQPLSPAGYPRHAIENKFLPAGC